MADKKVTVVDYAAEYFYAESLRQMNMHRLSVGLPVVSTTQGRKLHDNYMKSFHDLIAPGSAVYQATHGANLPTDLQARNNRIAGQLMGAMSYAFSDAMMDVNGGEHYYNMTMDAKRAGLQTGMNAESNAYVLGYDDSKVIAKQTLLHFMDQTKWQLGQAEEYDNDRLELVADDARLPLSPYDDQISMKRIMLENGGRVLWAKMGDIMSGAHTLRLDTEENLNLYVEGQDMNGVPDGKFEYRGKLNHPDDVSGLSRLRPYLSDADYKAVQPVIAHANVTYTASALEKSVAILQWLTDNGYTYTVSNDTNPGQLKARIGNSKLDIRILDVGENEKYIGRCYEEGYETYYLTAQQSGFTPSSEDIIRMISYTMGNQVERTSYNAGEISNVETRDRYGRVHVNKQKGVKRESDNVGRYAGEPASVFFKMVQNPTKGQPPIVVNMHQDGLMPFDAEDGTYPSSQVLMDVELGEDKGKYAKRDYRVVAIRSRHHASHEFFNTEEQATAFLSSAVETARQNYLEKLDIDRLIAEAAMYDGDPDYVPELSYDPEIAPIQLQYWEVLSGKRDLYRAGMTADDVYADITTEEDMDDATLALVNALFGDAANGKYEGTLAEQVQQHAADTLDLEFGSLEPSAEDGLRFNPWNVSKFMTSSFGQFRNNDNVVEAMKKLEINAEELRGNEFQTNQIKDKLIRFNPDTARQMGGEDASDFMKTLARTIQETISTSHCTVKPEDILIDDNGIVHYRAERMILLDKGNSAGVETVEGELGQIFEPDADGVVETHFNGSQNQLFSPGYLAYVLPQADGESKTLPERVRLKGYMQVLQENIRRQVRSDLLDPHATVGTTTNINNSYRGLYENRYKVHGEVQPGETLKDAYVRECRMTGLPDDAIQARFATFKGMVRLPSSFKEGSSLNAAFARSRESMSSVDDVMNDNARDAWQLSGGENISVLSEDWDGYTDKTATGSAKNQGVVRYLVEGAIVDENGVMHPARKEDGSIDKDARTALMSLPYMQYVDYTPFDRQQMVFSNLSGASAIDAHTGVATMTMGGYTFDDGAVISKAWAEKNGPLGEDGVRRPIGVGDKILDCAGNKSIVGKVIDTELSEEEFEKLPELEKRMVEFFFDNPQVSVVMSPYSPMSRFNATSARFAMADNFEIKLPDGSTTYGGYMPMIVTDKTVDEKTKEYGEEAVKAGGGRSASGQFNWILSGVGAYGLMDECYGNNESSLANYREYLITMGMDIDQTGRLGLGYQPHTGEERHVFSMPEPELLSELTRKSAADMFRGAVDNRGGFLEIPVQLTLPSGEKLEPMSMEQSSYTEMGIQMYKLPIMSSYLRSGQEFQDGTSMTHDYTNHYAQIYAASVAYLDILQTEFKFNPDAKDRSGKVISEEAQRAYFDKTQEKQLKRLESRMASEYHEITSDVEHRIFTGKHNYVRDHLMAARLPHSATAVWTAEPECKIDEIRMPSSMAKTLGKKDGDMVLAWRDPCLHRSNLMGLHVSIDDNLVGVAVNPLIAFRPDGDFDGDSVGLYGVQSNAGLKDLNDKLSMHNTLLDLVHKDPETGNYALFINTKMDVRSLYARDEEARAKAEAEGHPMEGLSLRERFADLENRANDIYQGRGEWANATFEEKDAANRRLCDEVSEWTHDVFTGYPIGAQTLSMESPAAYLQDLQRMADTKAKGKAANIADVAKYYGMTYEKHEDGSINYETIDVKDHTLATRQDSKDTQYAVAVKANGTPLGGQVSLNFAELARNLCLIDGLDLTYNATQAVLQAKHDPVMAKQQYGMLQGPLKAMWRGRKLESHMTPVWSDDLDDKGNRIPVLNEDGTQKYRQVWTEVHDEKGRPVPLTTQEWVNQFMEIHESPDGMNMAGDINREQVEFVAKSLTDPDTGTVYNIESEGVRKLLASPMDRLAYQPSLEATIESAKMGECIFEGAANEHLAPKIVRENIQKMRAYEAQQADVQAQQEAGVEVETSVDAPELKGFGKSDTMEMDGQKPVSKYQTSSRYVGENKKGIGSVVVGGYHEVEEKSLDSRLKEVLTPEDYAEYQANSKDLRPEDIYTQEELAKMYGNLDTSAPEDLVSAAALAAQEEHDSQLTPSEYEKLYENMAKKDVDMTDDIDDMTEVEDTNPEQTGVSVDDSLRLDLAEQAAQEKRVEDSASNALEEVPKDPSEVAEKADAQKEENKNKSLCED